MLKRTSPLLFAIIAFIVGLNLRPILASVGPLFSVLQREAGLTATQFSLLTTLPVAMMGLAALCGPWLLARIGAVRGIMLGLFILLVACSLRGFSTSLTGLMGTALLGGASIGTIQALMPALIKKAYTQTASTIMSLFSTGIMAGAAVAAASAEPLFSWLTLKPALAMAGVLALLALMLWLPLVKQLQGEQTAHESVTLCSSRTGLLLLFFGVGTGAYTLVLAWLPPLYIQAGWSARSSGYMLAWLTLTEVTAGFAVSALIGKFPDRRVPLITVLLLLLAGLLCLVFSPGTTPVLSTLLLGIGIGALFPLSLIVTFDHARTPAQAGKLLSKVQGGGYMIAALMPLVAGIVRDSSVSLNSAWLVMSAGVVLLIAIAFTFKPAVNVQAR
ncbi:MFS transporter [Enterobacter cloacae complex sp. S4]|uniref:MFS transporter n=1 Tax=Enterobacter roggenkampii TaxID=1812935 RepID=A0AAX1WLV7_9ENTR|nr:MULTISPECIES: MFS transporter [Enterobacter cloacae complex]CAE6255345.1 putative transporter YycB [Enterobacter cloacae]EHF8255389.1 CynX/NimT family MFS transporter [Enterobacter roggenkampii]ELD8600078.1 MFS transporter [Enterobacter roggenkampii]KTJ34077.1 MFS transporter [Enterobacter roggenkampii]MBE4867785.1 MFS transporter [Enterobacter cloacae complex sp. S4]